MPRVEWIVEPVYWHECVQRLCEGEIDCVEFAGRYEPCPKPFKSWDEFRAYAKHEYEMSMERMLAKALDDVYASEEKYTANKSFHIDRFAILSMPVILEPQMVAFVNTVL